MARRQVETDANPSTNRAVRLTFSPHAGATAGDDPDTDIRVSVRHSAQKLGVLGWVRTSDDDGTVEVHAEGPVPAVAQLIASIDRDDPR